VTGQYKKSDESTSDNDRSKVNKRCGGKEDVVNGSVHTVSTGGSLTGMQNTIKIPLAPMGVLAPRLCTLDSPLVPPSTRAKKIYPNFYYFFLGTHAKI
jgi:hypothetical protein